MRVQVMQTKARGGRRWPTQSQKQEPQARKGTHTLGAPVMRQAAVGRPRCSATSNGKQSIAAKAFPLRFVKVVYLLLGRTGKVHGCA
jgi:hypothetical protein